MLGTFTQPPPSFAVQADSTHRSGFATRFGEGHACNQVDATKRGDRAMGDDYLLEESARLPGPTSYARDPRAMGSASESERWGAPATGFTASERTTYVDDALRRMVGMPAPTRYDPRYATGELGESPGGRFSKSSLRSTLDAHIRRARDQPGPGDYNLALAFPKSTTGGKISPAPPRSYKSAKAGFAHSSLGAGVGAGLGAGLGVGGHGGRGGGRGGGVAGEAIEFGSEVSSDSARDDFDEDDGGGGGKKKGAQWGRFNLHARRAGGAMGQFLKDGAKRGTRRASEQMALKAEQQAEAMAMVKAKAKVKSKAKVKANAHAAAEKPTPVLRCRGEWRPTLAAGGGTVWCVPSAPSPHSGGAATGRRGTARRRTTRSFPAPLRTSSGAGCTW